MVVYSLDMRCLWPTSYDEIIEMQIEYLSKQGASRHVMECLPLWIAKVSAGSIPYSNIIITKLVGLWLDKGKNNSGENPIPTAQTQTGPQWTGWPSSLGKPWLVATYLMVLDDPKNLPSSCPMYYMFVSFPVQFGTYMVITISGVTCIFPRVLQFGATLQDLCRRSWRVTELPLKLARDLIY